MTPQPHTEYALTDLARVPQTPAFVINTDALENNLRILRSVEERTGARILLALKGFANYGLFPLVRQYLRGTSASGLHEALLAHEFFHGENHVYCPAYKPAELQQLLGFADTLIFNSVGQWQRYREEVQRAPRPVECGLRINPGYAEVEVEIYNPCAPGSRLGVTANELAQADLSGLSGLHFHSLCEQNSDTLERTLKVVKERFGSYFQQMKWFNFGGGHHITRPDYDIDLLCRLIEDFQQTYQVQVLLEPSEAIAIRTGVLVVEVLDIIRNGPIQAAILDTSATAHMPDVLEMPYRPEISGAGAPGEFAHTYRLGGLTCLAGDVIGDYSFPEPLQIGQRLCFMDMTHYTMVKTTTFNGVPLPAIATWSPAKDQYQTIRTFGYAQYKERL